MTNGTMDKEQGWKIIMIKDLEVILSKGESYTIEFKESADKSIASEVCAPALIRKN